MHTFGRCGRDPRGRQISVAFFGIASANTKKIKGGDDAAKAKWFDIAKLPEEMAFDHDEVIKFGIKYAEKKKCLPFADESVNGSGICLRISDLLIKHLQLDVNSG